MQRAPLTLVTYLAYALLGVAFVYTLVSFYVVRLPLPSLSLVLIRWIHFVGAFTAVGAIFTGFLIISPVLKGLSGDVQTTASNRLLPMILAIHVFTIDITMAGGLALAWFLSGGNLLVFVSTRWGLSVLSAGILTIVMQFNAGRALIRNGFTFNVHRPGGIGELLSYLTSPSEGSSSPNVSLLHGGLTGVIRTNFGLALIIMFLMGFAAHG